MKAAELPRAPKFARRGPLSSQVKGETLSPLGTPVCAHCYPGWDVERIKGTRLFSGHVEVPAAAAVGHRRVRNDCRKQRTVEHSILSGWENARQILSRPARVRNRGQVQTPGGTWPF